MNFEKIVKLACKPKAAAPKAKYLDPIIAATYGDDSNIHEVCRALALRLREPNVIVVFKALLVVHTMIRNGHTDNVLAFLSSSSVLGLKHCASPERDGYPIPENLANYALYLDTRVRAYRDLKHDTIRVQSDTNRDRRLSGGETAASGSGGNSNAPARSKTIMGRKLRSMTVEKGLLRETKVVQRQIDSLIDCKFYLDHLDDELTLTALRMLVKDLLILFQAENEGVINVLETYFEMSFVDAEQALGIYKYFCEQTERVVDFLGIARKLSNLLNVPIPNLKHAPVKLAGALEEYIKDPNFEQNRIEYKTNKALADGKIPNKARPSAVDATASAIASSSTSSPAKSAPTESKTTTGPPNVPAIDFFESIDGAATNQPQPVVSPNPFMMPGGAMPQLVPQATGFNPFRQSMMVPQMTGFTPSGGSPFVVPQVTGMPNSPFMAQQQPAIPGLPNMPTAAPFPFAQPQPVQAQSGPAAPFLNIQPTGSPFAQPQSGAPSPFQPSPQPSPFAPNPQNAFLQAQPTGFLQPQQTGSNPFRQSMIMPNMTGMPFPAFNGKGPSPPSSPQRAQSQPRSASSLTFSIPPHPQHQHQPTLTSMSGAQSSLPQSPFAAAMINRPASTPAGNPTQPKVLVPQLTGGSRNPFGPVKAPSPPPVPKAPTLQEIAAMKLGPSFTAVVNANKTGNAGVIGGPNQPSALTPTLTGASPWSMKTAVGGTGETPGGTTLSSIASSFTGVGGAKVASSATGTSTTTTTTANGSNVSDLFSGLSISGTGTTNSTLGATPGLNGGLQSQPTGFSGLGGSGALNTSTSPLKPQATGFAGLKAFQPTSAFGASLMENLPPASSTPTTTTTPGATNGLGGTNSLTSPGATSQSTGLPSFSLDGPNKLGATSPGVGAQPTGLPSFALNSQTPAGSLPGSTGITSTVGVGLRPQATGGASNPFRASMMAPAQGPAFTGLNGFNGGLTATPTGSFGTSLFSGAAGNAANTPGGTSLFRPTLATIPSMGNGFTPSFTNTNAQQNKGQESLI